MSKKILIQNQIKSILGKKELDKNDLKIIDKACLAVKLQISDPIKESLFNECEMCGKINKSIWFDVTANSKEKWRASIQHTGGDCEDITETFEDKKTAFLNGLIILLGKTFI